MIKESRYIIRRIIIGVGIALCLMFIKSCNVQAVDSDKWIVTVNGFNLYRNHQYYAQGNATLKLNYNATLPNMIDYSYGYVALCSASGKYDKVTSYYSNPLANTGGLGFYQDISITTTSIPCQMYNTTAYSSSTIIYFTFNSLYAQDWGASGTNGVWFKNASITFYHQADTEYSLLGYGFSKEPFIFDDANGALINQNDTIISQNETQINQNNTIINQNTQINESINDTNETMKDSNVDSPYSAINGANNSIATNGVITQLVTLPVTLFQKILNSVNGSCSSYNMGSLYGTDIILPCINVSNYIGSSLWSVIDVLISGLFVWSISRKMIKVFNNFSTLKEGDVLGD